MTTNQRSREAAYADLVSGLIDARIDVASDRFDAELEAAEASGRLDPATARLLRWWQRESVRAVTEHARTTVPTTLVALEKAEKEAREAVYRADAAWTTARGVSARATYADPTPSAPAAAAAAAAPVAPPIETESEAEPVVEDVVINPAPAPSSAPSSAETFVAPEPAPWSATVTGPLPTTPAPTAPSPAPWGSTLEPPNYPGAEPASAPTEAEQPGSTPPVATNFPPAPGEAPGIVDLTAHEARQDPGATPASGRRRTLLAGLTVLPRSD